MSLPTSVLAGWDVLVVEDDAFSADIARLMLARYDAIVHVAANGQEALDLIEQVRPKFIITDLSMPVMDGWALIEHLKNNPATADIPIIALTANALTADRERALAAGCENFLTKPFTPTSFMSNLITILKEIPGLNVSE